MGIRWLSDLAGTLRDFTVKGFLYVTGKYMTASGTDTYTASGAIALASYGTGGLEITVKYTNANTGAATLNVSSLGAIALQINGVALTAGQIAAGGTYVHLFDGTNFQLLGAGGGGTPATAWKLVRTITSTDWDTAVAAGTLDVWTPDNGDIIYDIAVAVGEDFNDSNGDSATIGPFRIATFAFIPGYTFTVGHSSLFDTLGYVRLVAKTPYASLTPPDFPLEFYGFPAIFVSTPTDPITADVSGGGFDSSGPDTNLYVWALVQVPDAGGGGGGGSTVHGTTTVDFGSGATDAIVSVSTSGSWTLANAFINAIASSNNTADAHAVENLQCYAKDIVAGTGFNVYVKCTQGLANGQYNVAWVVY